MNTNISSDDLLTELTNTINILEARAYELEYVVNDLAALLPDGLTKDQMGDVALALDVEGDHATDAIDTAVSACTAYYCSLRAALEQNEPPASLP